MIVIAESGSTKTDWVILNESRIECRFNSIGLNPVYSSSNELIEKIQDSIPKEVDYDQITSVYFYGAGCMAFEKADLMEEALRVVFDKSTITVKSDINAAAYSLFFNNPGIAVILGTGANVCVFDGNDITYTRSGLGYILGDEGSGAHIGKLFIQDFLNDFIPSEVIKVIDSQLALSKGEIINSLYKKGNANLYLSRFSKFIKNNIELSYFNSLVKRAFCELFEIHIKHIKDYSSYEIGFVGSVAFHFGDILTEVCNDYGVKMRDIKKKPIEGLIDYHLSILGDK